MFRRFSAFGFEFLLLLTLLFMSLSGTRSSNWRRRPATARWAFSWRLVTTVLLLWFSLLPLGFSLFSWYIDILGCSIRRFSIGFISALNFLLLLKHCGGATIQLSSIPLLMLSADSEVVDAVSSLNWTCCFLILSVKLKIKIKICYLERFINKWSKENFVLTQRWIWLALAH